MEVILLLSCALATLISANVRGAAIETPFHVVTLDEISQSDQDYIAYLEHEAIRQKRSEDVLSLLKEKISQGIKSKLGHIASASSHLSGSGKHHHHYEPHHGPDDETKMFDFWDLQKSILHTLLQAVKAIKGGLIAIKGQLIKGGGYIISAKGKLLSAKGEAITNMGKHIATSANLSPHPSHHSHHSEPSGPSGHSGPGIEYGPPPSSSDYGPPSGHGVEYHPPHHGPPSSGFSDHKYPSGFEAYKDHLPRGAHHGILILKKIPKGHKDKHNGNDGAHSSPDTHIPDSKPEEPSIPPFKHLSDIKHLFSASSFKKHEEKPSAPHPSEYPYSEYSAHEPPHHHHEPPPHHHELPHHHHEPSHHHHELPHHQHELPHHHHESPLSHYESPLSHHESPPSHHELSSVHHNFMHEPSPTPHQPSSTHYEQPSSLYQPAPNHYESPAPAEPQPTHYAYPTPTFPSAHHLSTQSAGYGTPLETSDNFAAYLKNYQNNPLAQSPNGPQPTAYLPNPYSKLPKLEAYDPLTLPNEKPSLTSSFPQTDYSKLPSFLSAFQNFPSYPVDLADNFPTQQKLSNPHGLSGYSVHEQQSEHFSDLQGSSSNKNFNLFPSIFSKSSSAVPKLPLLAAIDPELLRSYIHAQSTIQNKQSSHTRSVSRHKRPKYSDLIRYLTSRLGHKQPME